MQNTPFWTEISRMEVNKTSHPAVAVEPIAYGRMRPKSGRVEVVVAIGLIDNGSNG